MQMAFFTMAAFTVRVGIMMIQDVRYQRRKASTLASRLRQIPLASEQEELARR